VGRCIRKINSGMEREREGEGRLSYRRRRITGLLGVDSRGPRYTQKKANRDQIAGSRPEEVRTGEADIFRGEAGMWRGEVRVKAFGKGRCGA